MPTETDPRDIFVGREAEQAAFAATLDEVTAGAKRGLFGRAAAARQQARVCLVYGSGGLGKTELLRRFAEQSRAAEAAWVLLNWDDENDAQRLPNDFPSLLVRLRNSLAEQLAGDVLRSFKAFDAAHARRGELVQQVEKEASALAEQLKTAAVTAVGQVAAPAVAGKLGLPPDSAMNPVIEAGVKYAAELGAEGAAQLYALLQQRLAKILKPDDQTLYTNPNDAYAAAFIDGLAALSRARPLVIAQDTYEWISTNGQLDSLLRARVIKPSVRAAGRLVWVVAGRGSLADDYQRAFQSEPQALRMLPAEPFQAAEIAAVLRAYALPASLSAEFQRQTLGVPLAVNTLAALHARPGADPGEAGAAAEHTADVIQRTTDRFLRYIVEDPQDPPEVAEQKRADRHELYTLALLRTDDQNAQAACWGALAGGGPLPPAEVAARRQALRRRNEFLFERSREPMQKDVRHFVRLWLRQQVDPAAGTFEGDVVRRLNQAALAYYQGQLAQREQALPVRAERVDDPAWRALGLDELNHQLWRGEREGLQALGRRLLEVGNVASPFLPQLVQMAREALPEEGWLGALAAGAQTLQAEAPDLARLLALWDELARRLPAWRLPPVYTALLALHRGRVLTAAGRLGEAVQALTSGLDVLPAAADPELRQRLLDQLVGCAAILTLQQRDYPQALRVAERALVYDPDNARAENMRLLALMGQQDYAGAHALLDRLIVKYPAIMEFRWARQTLYNVQGRAAEAQQELIQISRDHPNVFQDLARVIAEQSRNPEAWQATAKWGQDMGWSAEQVAAYERLQKALSPEALAEVIAEQFKLLALKDPTPAQVLAARELVVRHLPDWPDAQLNLGAAYVQAGRLPEALSAFQAAQALAPTNPAVFTGPALLLYTHGHRAAALPYLERSAQLLPDNPGPAMLIIEYLAGAGRLPEARAAAERALETFPKVTMLRWTYGHVLLLSGNQAEGLQVQFDAYRDDPTLVEQWVQGLLASPPGELEKVRAQIKIDFPGEPGDVLGGLPDERLVPLYGELLRARLAGPAVGQLDLTPYIAVWTELLALKPESMELRLTLAEFLRETGDAQRAIGLLEEVVEQAPQPARDEARLLLARLYNVLQQSTHELRHLRQIQRPLTPDEGRILAVLLADASEFAAAVDVYDQTLAAGDDPDGGRWQRFCIYYRAFERWADAEAQVRRLAAAYPDHAEAHYQLAEVLFAQQRYLEALAAAQQAVALGGQGAPLSASLARLCRKLGQPAEAEAHQQQALQQLAVLPAYDQACVLNVLGLQAEALARLSEGLAQQPELTPWAPLDPDLHALRGHPAFTALLPAG